MVRCLSLLALFVIALAGCQGQPASTPVSKTTVPLSNEPMSAEVAQILEETDYETSLAKINQLIGKRPSDCMLYSVRSSIHNRHGHSQVAIEDLDKAISLNGKDARLFNNRGFIELGLQLFTQAMADFDKAVELTPDYANPYNNRGLLLIARGQFASAIEQFDQALRLDHNYVDAYNNRGFAALQLGFIDRALADFNAAIKLNSSYVNAFNNRGLLRTRVGDLDNAVVDFTQAMILDPLNPKYYEHRREVYVRQSAFDLAVVDETKHDWLLKLQEFNTRLLETPASTALLVERAKHYQIVDDLDKAVADLNRALQIDANCIAALMERGRCCLRQKDFAGAVADAAKVLALNPSQDAFSLSGDAHLGLKNFDKAIACYAAARRIDASVADAYYQKSQILQASGQQELAADTLKQAVALNPRLLGDLDDTAKPAIENTPGPDTEAVEKLMKHAQECLESKNFAAALTDATELLKISPSEDAYSVCGDAHLGLKNYDQAISCYAKAKRIDPSVAEAYFGKSQIERAAGLNAQALESLKLALSFNLDLSDESRAKIAEEMEPSLPKADKKEVDRLLKRGQECLEQKDFAGALEIATTILKMGPSQEADSMCGDAHLGLENYDKAIECFAKARRIDVAVAKAYYRKSLIQKAAGQTEQAAENLKYAIALDPDVTTRK